MISWFRFRQLPILISIVRECPNQRTRVSDTRLGKVGGQSARKKSFLKQTCKERNIIPA